MAQRPTPVTTDPRALATIVQGVGGTPIVGRNFTFDLPLEKVREVVPKINDLGLGVRQVSQRMDEHPTRIGNSQTIATLELYRK
jgi:hypothetical protein